MIRHDFIVHSLPQDILDRIQALPPEELARQNILRLQVDANPGYPCRLSLRDAFNLPRSRSGIYSDECSAGTVG